MAIGPFDNEHAYLQWGGKLPGGDIWSCGLRMQAANGSVLVDVPGMLTAVTAAVQAFHTRASGGVQINARALLSFVKFNAIGTDGKYINPTTNESLVADVPGGYTVTTGNFPNQIALAVTLLTDVARGPAAKGRFYVPLPAYDVQTDGRIAATYATNAETGVMTFVDALNAINPAFAVAVFSRVSGKATHRVVTGATVGRVLDTQRRRRNKLAESYS